jgi:hypothetical protein
VDVQTHIFLTSALVGEWSASRPGRFNPWERAPSTHSLGGWVSPRAGLDDVEKRKFLTLPGLKIWSLSCAARSQSLHRLCSWWKWVTSFNEMFTAWHFWFIYFLFFCCNSPPRSYPCETCQQLNSCNFLNYQYFKFLYTPFPLLHPLPTATGLTCVAALGTPRYSRAAAEVESWVADWSSLALPLQVSGTSPIPFGWRALYLIYGQICCI